MQKDKKKSGIIKTVVLFILFFLGIPLSILTVLYLVNDDVNNAVSDYLREAPGIVGEYFNKYPTEVEKNDKEIFLAKYYLSLDKESATDKLYIIKKDDELLYNNVIKRMNGISSSKTSEIIKLVRNIELRKDLLFNIYEEIIDEYETQLVDDVKRIEQMDINIAINEINNMIKNNTSNEDTISSIFERLDEEKATEILYFLEPDISAKIMSTLRSDRRQTLETLLYEKAEDENKLKALANLFEAKNTQEAFEEIGNTDNYDLDQLALIYMSMDVKKASEILVYNTDEEFIRELFTNIEKQERLRGIEQSVTPNIAKAMSFINQYSERVNELVALYEKMDAIEAAGVVEKMLANKDKVSSLNINENSLFEISDSSIIIDVLKEMKKQSVSDILSNLESKKAAEITRILATQ